jgi:hypothetical protein
MADKAEIRFDKRWATGPRSKGGIAFIVDPADGTVTILGYKDGQIVSSIETTLGELEAVVDQGNDAYDSAHPEQKYVAEAKDS